MVVTSYLFSQQEHHVYVYTKFHINVIKSSNAFCRLWGLVSVIVDFANLKEVAIGDFSESVETKGGFSCKLLVRLKGKKCMVQQ